MRAGIDIGINPQRADRALAACCRDYGELDALFLAFKIELPDPGLEPLDHFVRLLAHA